ncbi:MAG: SLC13 family permease [Planctomycetota bacterium]
MTFEQLVVLGVLAGAFLAFVTERLPVDLVGLLVMVALAVTGVLTPEQTFGGFASSALITIACMFVLSEGLIRTGALDIVTESLLGLAHGKKPRLVVALMLAVALSSAFVNNTPVAVIFLPVVLAVAVRLDVLPSRLLLPMSYASILGGTCTLIGTSTNLLVSQVAEQHGYRAIGMFELSVPGLIFAAIGFLYLATIGRRLLPKRATVTTSVSGGRIREFVTEIQFRDNSPLVEKSYQEVLAKVPGVTPLMVIRGEETYMAPLLPNPRTQFIRGGDVLLLKGEPGSINALVSKEGVTLPPELGALMAAPGVGKALTMVELVVNPNSPMIDRTIANMEFSRRHGGASVIAILRRDEHLRERVGEIRLRMGDTLLVACDEAHLDDLRHTDEFILLEGVSHEVLRRGKAPLAMGIMVMMVTLAALGVLPIASLALAAVAVMVVAGCLPLRLAYGAINSQIVILIAGMLALGTALETTGLAHMASGVLLDTLRDSGTTAIIAGMYLLAMLLTQLVSNNAVAVLLTPIALETGQVLGYEPAPFLFAVLFGASAAFATPIGYQTNLFVYGPGGYRFGDYLRVGGPLNVVLFLAALFVIPWWFPFVPVAS